MPRLLDMRVTLGVRLSIACHAHHCAAFSLQQWLLRITYNKHKQCRLTCKCHLQQGGCNTTIADVMSCRHQALLHQRLYCIPCCLQLCWHNVRAVRTQLVVCLRKGATAKAPGTWY